MKTRDLKSLSETIASVVDPIDKERAQMLQEGFLNSLTEKARQIASKEMEDEDEEEETLDEAVSAKRMRIIRKYVKGNKRVPEHLKDYMERSFKKKRAKDAKLSDGRGAVGALETRMRRKSAALRARGIEPKGVAPGYLEEGILKKLRRAKGAAYAAMQKGEGDKYAKLHGVASGLESRYKASMARRGGATPETVKGAGSRLSKKGKYTLKAGKLATQHDKALASFRSKVRTAELFGRGSIKTDKGAKRERQQAQAAFVNKARTGDFGQDNQASLRARSNFQKRYGRLKGK